MCLWWINLRWRWGGAGFQVCSVNLTWLKEVGIIHKMRVKNYGFLHRALQLCILLSYPREWALQSVSCMKGHWSMVFIYMPFSSSALQRQVTFVLCYWEALLTLNRALVQLLQNWFQYNGREIGRRMHHVTKCIRPSVQISYSKR